MYTKTTAHFGSTGRAASIVACGTEAEIKGWANHISSKGYAVEINQPTAKRPEWQAHAVYKDVEGLSRSHGHSTPN